ncbi:alpha-2-macroglobulin-like protein 1 [Rhynochetos jubatus]
MASPWGAVTDSLRITWQGVAGSFWMKFCKTMEIARPDGYHGAKILATEKRLLMSNNSPDRNWHVDVVKGRTHMKDLTSQKGPLFHSLLTGLPRAALSALSWLHGPTMCPPPWIMGSAATLPCLLLCTLYLTAGASAEPHYVVLFPSVLYYPYTGKVHIHLMDLDGPVRVTLHLESSHSVPSITLEQQGNGTLQLNWPSLSNVSTPSAGNNEVAHLHVSIQGSSLQVSQKKKVLVKALQLGTLVQTDKDVYNPGQTVKFRIVRLDQNFIPSNKELPLVAVQDPHGNHVAQWQDVSPRQGIVDLSFPLAAEPALGMYTIEVEGKRHSFSVKGYGLPHFEVLIRLPHVVMGKDEKIPMDICGRYPSRKTFRGRAEARLCHTHKPRIFPEGSTGNCAEFRGQTGRNGCFSTEVLMSSFNLTGFHYRSWLYAYASLLEERTGMRRFAVKRCNIVYEIATITFENTDKFYKPGIPDTGTVLLKGTNVSALKEEFLLMVNDSGEIQNKTLPIDESGQASFELDTSGWNDKVSLHGELKDYQPASEPKGNEHLNHRSVTRSLHPFSSDHKSFLRIHKVKRKLPCGQPQRILVDYSFDDNAKGIKQQSLDVVILVLAKGTTATVLRRELPQEAGLRGSFSLELHIGPELAPTAKVLGYTVLTNGEMVADSTELKVAKCFPNKVTLSLEQRAPVGSELRLKVQASPGSLCAIYTVDQHTQSSGPQGKLSPSTVYNLLPRFPEVTDLFEEEEYDCWLNSISVAGIRPAINCYDAPGNDGRECRRRLWRREVLVSKISTSSYHHVMILLLCTLIAAGFLIFGSPILAQGAGLKIVTNAQLGCQPIIQHQRHKSLLGFPGAELEEDEGVMQDTETKTYFLGTWLWELVPVGPSLQGLSISYHPTGMGALRR